VRKKREGCKRGILTYDGRGVSGSQKKNRVPSLKTPKGGRKKTTNSRKREPQKRREKEEKKRFKAELMQGIKIRGERERTGLHFGATMENKKNRHLIEEKIRGAAYSGKRKKGNGGLGSQEKRCLYVGSACIQRCLPGQEKR